MMRICRILTVSALLGLSACSSSVRAREGLIWSDEFNAPLIDATNWEHVTGDGTANGLPAGWGNRELQYYTDRPENSFVADGSLHLVARRESMAGYSYTSARLRSRNLRDFLYGKMEARIKLPSTKGIWPAFWMVPTESTYGGWAASGEIDIMESVNIATTIHGTIHFGGQWPKHTSSGGKLPGDTDYSTEFHTYAVQWQPDSLRWYVDDVLYHTETSDNWYSETAPDNARAPFDQPFYFILNLAVGGNFPGGPDESSSFPQQILIDWVQIYQLDTK